MSLADSKNLRIRNKRAGFEYELLEKFNAGIMLKGTEIKSIREGKVNIGDAFCFFRKEDLFIRNLNISEYSKGTHYNHEPMRERKLLLTKRELLKLLTKTKEKGFTIIPVSIFMSDRGFAKVEIALARGKKVHDKRESIRDRDSKREIDRAKKGE
jgi:SsrA-binding protein